MKKGLYVFLVCLVFGSCQNEKENDLFALRAIDHYLNLPIDENTRIPKFCLWTFENDGKEYLAFPNRGKEILFYDLDTQQLIKKVEYETEGANGVESIYSFGIKDFDHIYIASTMSTVLYVTDTTAQVRSKVSYEETKDGLPLVPTFVHNITYSPMYFFGDSLYIAQTGNPRLGGDYLNKSPLGVMIDTVTHQITSTPLNINSSVDINDLSHATGGSKFSTCYDGKCFVYSNESLDSVYKLSCDFTKVTKYPAKSRYVRHPKIEILPSDADVETTLKRKCELPAYGNLVYDKYRDVYYRFVFPEVELGSERSYLDIYHNGRKQFSIMILDKDMNVLGETLFPEYTYNAYLFFVRKDGLYLSVSHFKRSDFNENVFRFQKIELVKK